MQLLRFVDNPAQNISTGLLNLLPSERIHLPIEADIQAALAKLIFTIMNYLIH